MISLIKNILHKLVNHGIKDDFSVNKKKHVKLLNQFALAALIVFIGFTILLAVFKILFTPFVAAYVGVCFLFFALYQFLVDRGEISLAKIFSLVNIYLCILFFELYLGTWAGSYLFNYAFILLNVTVFSLEKQTRAVAILMILLFLCHVIPQVWSIKLPIPVTEISPLAKRIIFVFNASSSFLLMFIFALGMVRMNTNQYKKLKSNRLFIQSVIDNSNGLSWSVDNNYNCIAVNKNFRHFLLGKTSVDFKEGDNFETLVGEHEFFTTIDKYCRDTLNGKSWRTYLWIGNKCFEFISNALEASDRSVIGATFWARDISKLRSQQDELENLTYNLETLINNCGGSIWSFTNELTLITANEEYKQHVEERFGIKMMPGKNLYMLLGHANYPPRFTEFYEKLLKGERIFSEYEDENKTFEITGVPLYKANGEQYGAMCFARDITEKSLQTKELIAARRVAEDAAKAKARFFSAMSHELRTPLNGLLGITNLLQVENKDTALSENLQLLKFCGDHMLNVINDVLDFDKSEAGKLLLNISSLKVEEELHYLSSFFKVTADTKSIAFVTDYDGAPGLSIEADGLRLRQVLTNLIGNAIKFTEKGHVKLSLKATNVNEAQIQIRFTVEDTGIGIKEADLDTIFKTYEQANFNVAEKYGGTGLGLTISKKLVEIMGGDLTVTSSENVGSSFSFTLKFKKSLSQFTIRQTKHIDDFTPFDNLHVLVVDDNKLNRLIVKKMLMRWGVTTTEATTGVQALSLIQSNDYSIILMDIEMPEMNGFEATQTLRKTHPAIPVIALTAHASDEIEEKIAEAGFTNCIVKPFLPHELHEKISATITKFPSELFG